MANAAPPTTTTIVPLPSRSYRPEGGISHYTIRSLAPDESEIGAWCGFCASVFADKKPIPPPPEYFQRHYDNDPNRHASLIRVATVRRPSEGNSSEQEVCDDSKEEEIVASCRVFLRRIYVNQHADDDDDDDGEGAASQQQHQQVDVGGIGEVCTSPHHRRMGLSRELLSDCFVMMKDQAKLSISFLHAAPAFFPVYEGAGYRRTTTSWTVAPYHHVRPAPASSGDSSTSSRRAIRVRRARFPHDTEPLSELYHESYASVSGCLVRTTEYWESYLAQEWEDRMWVATAASRDHDETDVGGDESVLGWIVARFRGTTSDTGTRRVQICDLGLSSRFDSPVEATHRDAGAVFDALLGRAVPELCVGEEEGAPDTHGLFDVVLPTLVADRLLSLSGSEDGGAIDWPRSKVEIDEGWMYKALDDDRAAALVERLRSDPRHLMWPADSF